MKSLPLLLAIGAFATVAAPARAVDLPTRQVLPLATAQQLAGAALKACAADGYRISATVVDASGVIRAQLRGDGAGPHTLESSRKKAYTSASLGRPTGELAQLIQKMPEAVGLRDMGPDILILGGGLPLTVKGETVGGIGVGGAPGGHLDQACAQAAIAQVLPGQ